MRHAPLQSPLWPLVFIGMSSTARCRKNLAGSRTRTGKPGPGARSACGLALAKKARSLGSTLPERSRVKSRSFSSFYLDDKSGDLSPTLVLMHHIKGNRQIPVGGFFKPGQERMKLLKFSGLSPISRPVTVHWRGAWIRRKAMSAKACLRKRNCPKYYLNLLRPFVYFPRV